MKRKLICLVMALLMVFPLAVSCKKDPVTPPANPNEINIVSDGATTYSIIRSAKLTDGSRISKACVSLVDSIKEKTGVEIPIKTDDEAPSDYEIIVGDTTREESVALKSELGNKHYGYKVVGNKIVIIGGSDAATLNAVNYFTNTVVLNANGKTKSFSIAKDKVSLCKGEAGNKNVSIMGTPIDQYMIVIPQQSLASEERIANYLSGRLEKLTGKLYKVVNDKTEYEHEILIGSTARTTIESPDKDAFRVSADGGKLQFRASSMIGYIELFDFVLDELFNEQNVDIEITENFEYTRSAKVNTEGYSKYLNTKNGEYRVLFQNVWGNTDPNNAHIVRHKMTLELCLAYDADVVAFQEFNPKNRKGGINAFDKILEANGYAEVVPQNVASDRSKNFTPIFYRADKFDLVDCAYYKYPGSNDNGSKSYTWAVLKDKSTGDQFAVLSTHFWYAHETAADDQTRMDNAKAVVEAVETIEKKYGEIAVFCGGDYNCNAASGPVKYVLNNAGAVSAAYAAKEKDNVCSHHAYPTYSSTYNTFTQPVTPTGGNDKSIDHVLVANHGAVNLNLYKVSLDLYSLLTSDHCALFVDFDVK